MPAAVPRRRLHRRRPRPRVLLRVPRTPPRCAQRPANSETAANGIVHIDASAVGVDGVKAALQQLRTAGANLATAAGDQLAPQVDNLQQALNELQTTIGELSDQGQPVLQAGRDRRIGRRGGAGRQSDSGQRPADLPVHALCGTALRVLNRHPGGARAGVTRLPPVTLDHWERNGPPKSPTTLRCRRRRRTPHRQEQVSTALPGRQLSAVVVEPRDVRRRHVLRRERPNCSASAPPPTASPHAGLSAPYAASSACAEAEMVTSESEWCGVRGVRRIAARAARLSRSSSPTRPVGFQKSAWACDLQGSAARHDRGRVATPALPDLQPATRAG